jgi:putative flippase GtrA
VQIGHQFVRFALVGTIGTAGHYVSLLLLVRGFQLSPVVASAVGSVVGALINYVLNYRFTFGSQAAHGPALTKFMLVAAVGVLINVVTMWLGVNRLHLGYILVQLGATALVLMFGFVLNRAWTFRTAQS